MVNPAFELAKIFEGWKLDPKPNPVGARRNYAKQIGLRESEVLRLGMSHLVDIASRISDLKARGIDVSPFEYGIRFWQDAFMTAATATSSSPASGADFPITEERLNGLKSFGLVLDAHAAGLQPRPEFVARIEQAIDQAQEFVRSADISEELQHYLLGLLARIRAAMHEGRPSQMREAVNEFVGATLVAEETAEEGKRKGWADMRNNLLQSAIAGAAGNLLSQGIGVVAGFIGGAAL